MMKHIIKGLLVGVVLTATVQAKVQLTVPEEISLAVVNLEKPQMKGSFLSSHKTVELPDGVNQIAFRYAKPFVNRDTVDNVYSDLVVLRFNATDQTLTFQMPNYRNAQQAKKEIAHFEWQLIDLDNQKPVEQVSDVVPLSGFVLGQNFVDDIVTYNKQAGKAAITMSYLTIDNSLEKPSVNSHNPAPASSDALLDDLQALYLKADKEQRKAFRKWMIDQE
ncbi:MULTISPECIES: DUF2057 family protein [Vibrio]|uniref:DUF2057 family protein n=1 Tax=Vibrio TaxID=662 RepID=UPI0012FFD9C5|nr:MULTISPECIES: DUF2057 family protein [Vibrio]NAW70417.1 DUF2057 domain-containing protein [Vibrio sp. V28_P6S34P95]NAX04363.1 DUF2057 domain-containing protein [Vibrio sp. V30_P3S12P165]NAX33005.1 DUF2057 domain-containing protein [Vibrio sp. V29_P1S30P107]NAX37208.1 DUF2057 domain-containing protein [Vibrio sp. V27_P1S3P104]